MSQSEGWGQYARAHPERGFESHFPVKEGKKPRAINWLYSSHIFTETMHETPNRPRIRDLLIDPPEPPFLFIVALSGQKQVIFKGQIASSRERFPVQADDERIYVEREPFAQMMTDFEAMYAMGFSRDSVAQNRDWNQARIMHIGLSTWKAANARMDAWRNTRPEWVMLAAFCAQRPADWVDPMKQPRASPQPAETHQPAPPPTPAPMQASLF